MMKRVIIFTIISGLFFQFSFGIDLQVHIKEPFVVRSVQGTIKVEGGWSESHRMKDFVSSFSFSFKIYGPGNSNKVWEIQLDNDGRFKRKVPKGKYKFEIKVSGWHDYVGTIIVTKKAKKKATIDIFLELN